MTAVSRSSSFHSANSEVSHSSHSSFQSAQSAASTVAAPRGFSVVEGTVVNRCFGCGVAQMVENGRARRLFGNSARFGSKLPVLCRQCLALGCPSRVPPCAKESHAQRGGGLCADRSACLVALLYGTKILPYTISHPYSVVDRELHPVAQTRVVAALRPVGSPLRVCAAARPRPHRTASRPQTSASCV